MVINMVGGSTPQEGGTISINNFIWNTNPENAASAYTDLTGSVKGYWPNSTSFTKQKFVQEAALAQPSISVSTTGLITATANATDLISNLASSTSYTDGSLRLVRMPGTRPSSTYQIPKYTGNYYITPSSLTQVLATQGKFMTNDLTIYPGTSSMSMIVSGKATTYQNTKTIRYDANLTGYSNIFIRFFISSVKTSNLVSDMCLGGYVIKSGSSLFGNFDDFYSSSISQSSNMYNPTLNVYSSYFTIVLPSNVDTFFYSGSTYRVDVYGG